MRVAKFVGELKGWIYQPILLLLIAGGAVAGLFASREFDQGDYYSWDYVLFGTFVLLLLSAAAWEILREVGRSRRLKDQEEAIIDARVKLRTDFGDALDPAIEEIGILAATTKARDRAEVYGRVMGLLLTAACQLVGPGEGRIRASFFEHRAGTSADPEGLYHYLSAGREASSFNFLAGSAIGDEALRMVMEGDYLYEPDVATAPPLHWTTGKPATYEAFLSVGCGTKRTWVGMLTVDSTHKADIDLDDLSMLRVIGRLVSLAHTLKS